MKFRIAMLSLAALVVAASAQVPSSARPDPTTKLTLLPGPFLTSPMRQEPAGLTLLTGPFLKSPPRQLTLTPAGWVTTAGGLTMPVSSPTLAGAFALDDSPVVSLALIEAELAAAKKRLKETEARLEKLLAERDAAMAREKALEAIDSPPTPAKTSPPARP